MKRGRQSQPEVQEARGFNQALCYNSVGANVGDTYAMRLSAVYRSVDVVSASVAQLPLVANLVDTNGNRTRMYNHPIAKLINRRPDARMNRYGFFQTIVMSMLLRGNAYALIERDAANNVVNLKYIDSNRVFIAHDPYNENIRYMVNGGSDAGEYMPHDILHFINISYNGIEGISTLRAAANALNIAASTDETARGFFVGGCNVGGILSVQGVMTEQQKTALKKSWKEAFDKTNGTPNGVAVLEGNMSFEKVTMNAADAQLLQCREFNVVEIARFFGVSPVKLFDLTKSSYSTVEATQLSFLTDTLAPLLEKIEEELEYKLCAGDIDLEFDTNRLLKIDKISQASRLTSLVNGGVISPNEARAELGLSPVEGGDEVQIQVNMQKINQEGSEDGEGDKNAESDGDESGSTIEESAGLRSYIQRFVAGLRGIL